MHPGFGKCGSSSIQAFINNNIDKLKLSGIYVSGEHIINWVPYFEQLIENNTIYSCENLFCLLKEKAKKNNCDTIIISAENLSNRNTITKGKQIHDIIASLFDEISILLYIRRQDEFLLSSWQQWWHKKGRSLKSYIDNALKLHVPDYFETAKFFEKVYGKESLSVIPFHRKAFKCENLISDFDFRAQLNISFSVDHYENKSLNPYLCEILSRIPNIYQNVDDNSIKELLAQYSDQKTILFDNDKTILNENQKTKILKHFENDNRILHKKYFEYLPYDDIFGNELTVGKDEPLKTLEHEIDRLKDVISIQMEIIIKLLKQEEKKENTKNKR